ncbi:MAG: hypothetical protein NVSMB22_05560 [Chloroflexota bacterium]
MLRRSMWHHFLAPLRLFVLLCVLGSISGLSTYASAQAAPVYLPGFPLLKQQHPLTCESAAASMATRGTITESQIMAILPRHLNPNFGFRGNPDGVEGKKNLIDYGVYAAPIHRALTRFGYQSDVITYGTDAQIKSYIHRGWPVVVWMTYALKPAVPRLAAVDGVQFFLVPWEHAVLVVGYDAGTLLANDPWNAQLVRYRWSAFNRSWGLFGNMALAVQTCLPPQPVSAMRVQTPSADSVTWTWNPSPRANRYRLTLTGSGSQRKVIYTGEQPATSFTYQAPRPGHGYVLTVTAVSQCGTPAMGTSVWYIAPRLPSPTATPSATPAEATLTATSTPSTAATVVATPPAATSTAVVGPVPTRTRSR